MGLRQTVLLASISALLFLGALAPGFVQASSFAPLVLELGYGPQDLVNVASEVPIFVPGDQLWASYSYNQSLVLSLVSPTGVLVTTSSEALGTVFLVYSFDVNDILGLWTLGLRSQSGAQLGNIPIEVVPVGGASSPSIPRLVDLAVTKNGSLDLSFVETTNLANGLSACLLPWVGTTNVVGGLWPARINLPQQVGNYTLELDEQNGSLRAGFVTLGGGGAPPPFDMWVELRYTYSFSTPLNSHLIIKGEQRVAETQPLVFTPPLTGSSFTLPLLQQVSLRVGTYTVLVYFRNSAGLFLEETSVLLLKSGSWLWYGACSPLIPASGYFKASVPLITPKSWPSMIIVTYENNGTQSYVEANVPVNLTSISISPTPWGGQLPSGYTIGTIQNKDVISAQIFGGNLYVQLPRFPTSFQAYVRFQGSDINITTFNVTQKYDLLQWGIPLGKLQVAVQLDSKYAPGAVVKVTDGAGLAASGTTGASGTASFLLPPGIYNILTTLSNISSTQQAHISGTLESTLVFSFTTPTNYWPEYALLALAVLGAAANVLVWRGLLRRGV